MSKHAGNVIAFKKSSRDNYSPSTSQTKIKLLDESESTKRIEQIKDGVQHLQVLLKRLNEVFAEAKLDDWDGEGAEAVSDAAYYNATRMLSVLPYYLPPPDIIPDNDGYIEFEWSKDNKNFSIYVTDTNLLLYAGYFGDNNRLSGRFNYEGCIPGHVELLAKEVFKEEIK